MTGEINMIKLNETVDRLYKELEKVGAMIDRLEDKISDLDEIENNREKLQGQIDELYCEYYDIQNAADNLAKYCD